MFSKLKMKFAARRVNNTHRRRRNGANRRPTFWGRVWRVITWPFRAIWALCKWLWKMLGRLCRWIWTWLCGLDLVGLLNLTLLIAIIVLFSMLIIDIVKCRRDSVVVMTEPTPVPVTVVHEDDSDIVADIEGRKVRVRRLVKLPIARDVKTQEFLEEPVNVVPVKTEECLERQTARVDDTIYGDVIVDSREAGATLLRRDTHVRGNVYIQNMRKYILPCGMHIDGNLFLRDMRLLEFCGEFTVTGNIYVSPRSSFGPIPAAARIGGQVIL